MNLLYKSNCNNSKPQVNQFLRFSKYSTAIENVYRMELRFLDNQKCGLSKGVVSLVTS